MEMNPNNSSPFEANNSKLAQPPNSNNLGKMTRGRKSKSAQRTNIFASAANYVAVVVATSYATKRMGSGPVNIAHATKPTVTSSVITAHATWPMDLDPVDIVRATKPTAASPISTTNGPSLSPSSNTVHP